MASCAQILPPKANFTNYADARLRPSSASIRQCLLKHNFENPTSGRIEVARDMGTI